MDNQLTVYLWHHVSKISVSKNFKAFGINTVYGTIIVDKQRYDIMLNRQPPNTSVNPLSTELFLEKIWNALVQ